MDDKSVHLMMSGKVQGVFYRSNTRDKALRLGLSGWVRNLADGRVEAFAEGPEDKVSEFVAYCRDNPGYSRVDDVKEEWGKPTGRYEGFKITH
ncbi:MAG: acylphosphatase [Candidatus Altiarchaeota archaeon]